MSLTKSFLRRPRQVAIAAGLAVVACPLTQASAADLDTIQGRGRIGRRLPTSFRASPGAGKTFFPTRSHSPMSALAGKSSVLHFLQKPTLQLKAQADPNFLNKFGQ
ncbi:hypothetical protein J2T08_000036 [Neorhizobium galegae]|nr:hypothetical protein [Neorhizobium galegae]